MKAIIFCLLCYVSFVICSSGFYVRGDYLLFGNTLGQDCGPGIPTPVVGTAGSCGTNTADSGIDTWWTLDVNGANPTANSGVASADKKSTAVLVLPNGATVVEALLFYSGMVASSSPDSTVNISRHGVFEEQVSTSCVMDYMGLAVYQCMADVSSILTAHGAGAYTISDVETAEITNVNNAVMYSAWYIYVVYEDSTEQIRWVDFIDPFAIVSSGDGYNHTFSGLLISPTYNSGKVSYVGYEGDDQGTGDYFNLDGLAVSNAIVYSNNAFCSARTVDGVAQSIVGDLPQLTGTKKSMSGFDMHTVHTPLTGDSLTIEAGTTSDVFALSAVFLSLVWDYDAVILEYHTITSTGANTAKITIYWGNNGTASWEGNIGLHFSQALYKAASSEFDNIAQTDAADLDFVSCTGSDMLVAIPALGYGQSYMLSFEVTVPPTTALTILVSYASILLENTGVTKPVNPFTITVPAASQTSGDPHFYGLLGQKYDVMGESYEIYNIITAPYLQINSRFTPYYKTATQLAPTGTMMGELGIKFYDHFAIFNSNNTVAIIDKKEASLTESWKMTFGDYENEITLEINANNKKFYEIVLTTPDLVVTFIRKVYNVAGLEPQFHFDYKFRLLRENYELHGLLGQTWENKEFADKAGAFKFLDGYEDDYRIKSNSLLGDDFKFNKFVNM